MPFEKGKSGNPAGRPSGRQAFVDRARRFLEDYTVEDLVGLANDRVRFGKLCVYDAMIVNRLVAALTRNGGRDMERILDRVIGKPAQAVEVQSTNVSYADLVAGSIKAELEQQSGSWEGSEIDPYPPS